MPDDYPKAIKRLIREYGVRAYEAELNEALHELDRHFAAWRAGELNSFDLNSYIHEFHQGPSRQLWSRYTFGLPDAQIAAAIATGLLKREEIPAELLCYLEEMITRYQQQDIEEENDIGPG